MTEDLNISQTLDQKGLLCPLPIINTAKEIAKLSSGEILKVISTDPGAPVDFEGWAHTTGNILLDSIIEDTSPKTFVFHIKKK
jgi:tRNA 2-thiouridine synthesizing protein A|tara:strand:- start:122 stop:370 length:249 start_codon:yes stop_codon:yes gene_type:complete